MAGIMRIFRDLFTDSSETRALIVQRLKEVKEEGLRIELEPVKSMSARQSMIVVSIEDIDDSRFIVSQPPPESARSLMKGKRFLLGFFHRDARYVGQTICRGRIQQELEGDRVLYGYRFSIPESLVEEERRKNPRKAFALGEELDVELTSFEHRSPIFGRVIDLSKGGMRILCANGMNKLRVGQDVYLKIELPAPVGLLTELVRVVELSPGKQSHDLTVSISFQAPVSALVDLIDNNSASHSGRRAG